MDLCAKTTVFYRNASMYGFSLRVMELGMRLTQIIAFLNGEIPRHKCHRLSHFDPSLCWDDFKEDEKFDSDKMITNDT